MTALLQGLILLQAYICTRGQLSCSLQSTCILLDLDPASMLDAMSMEVRSEVGFSCTVPSSPQGDLSVTWWLNNVGDDSTDTEIETRNSSFFTSIGNTLTIKNVGSMYEGLYKCQVMDSGSTTMLPKQPVGCLFVLGQGAFRDCPTGCVTETMVVQEGETAILNAQVVFLNGGQCANQGVRLLRVTKDESPQFVYVCSNLMGFTGPCMNNTVNYPRFRVVTAPEHCDADCKYNILLLLPNFNSSDVGVYTVNVIFDSVVQRIITRRFHLQFSNESVTTTTTAESPVSEVSREPSPQNIGASVGGSVAGILVLAVFIVIVVVVVWYRMKCRKSEPIIDPNLEKTEDWELKYNNHPDSVVSSKIGLSEKRERPYSFIETVNDLSVHGESEPADV